VSRSIVVYHESLVTGGGFRPPREWYAAEGFLDAQAQCIAGWQSHQKAARDGRLCGYST
jgi:hypothetical protein